MRKTPKAKLSQVSILKAAARAGDTTAELNIPVAYRDAGNMRRAFYWWKRCSDAGDGDACVDVGYCLHHGIGVRRDLPAAKRAYALAIAPELVTDWGREEAMYFLALAFLDKGATAREKQKAKTLLLQANRDGDYPEAQMLLDRIESTKDLSACHCRRGLRRTIKGQAPCPMHEGKRRRV
jgi:TPR repeat protein